MELHLSSRSRISPTAARAHPAPPGLKFIRTLVAIVFGLVALSTVARGAEGGVLILGGTGQLGAEVAKTLVAAGEDVSVLARATSDRSRLDGLKVTFVTGDMLSEPDMERVFKAKSYRAVVDASNAPFNGPQEFYENSQRIVSKWAAATGVAR